MKRIFAILLSAVLLLSLSACGGAAQQTPTTAPAQTAPTEAETAATTAPTEPPAPKMNIEPTVVVDNEACRIEITGGGETEFGMFGLRTTYENKTADKVLRFDVKGLSVNGLMCSAFNWFENESDNFDGVAPGTTANVNIVISGVNYPTSEGWGSRSLEELGIERYTDICVEFDVWDLTALHAMQQSGIFRDSVHLYPYGEDAAAAYAREAGASDAVVYESDTVKLTQIGPGVFSTGEYDAGTYYVPLYMENKSDSLQELSVANYQFPVKVNGQVIPEAELYFDGTRAFGGAAAYPMLVINSWELDKIGVTPETGIEEISFTLWDFRPFSLEEEIAAWGNQGPLYETYAQEEITLH